MCSEGLTLPGETQLTVTPLAATLDRSPANRQIKKPLSQNSGELHGLAPDFKGSEAVFQVDPLIIVKLHILRHRLFDFGPARKFSPIQALCFQRPESRIVIRASDIDG